MSIKEKIESLLKKSLKNINIEENIIIEIPKDKKNGDFSTNIAMQLAKKIKSNPKIIAEQIIKNIEENEIVEKLEIANPGFINFYIKPQLYFNVIKKVINLKENYGKSLIKKPEKINLEYVSANPTGILHLGTARGAAYGDNLYRIMKYAGYDVTREYYINDAGSQINNLGLSIKTRYENICGILTEMPKDGYYAEEIKEIAKKIYEKDSEKRLKEDLEFFKNFGVKTLLERLKEDLKLFRVEFDIFTSEKEIRNSGKIEKALKKLEELDNIYVQEEATWLKTTKYGDDKDRVIIKKDKEYTYLVPDIAYHLDKIERGYDILIDVLGSDHHGYISRLKASIQALGYNPNKIEIKMLQMVKLLKNNEEIKMSKRTGNTVTIRELIEEVGTDAARYFFAMRSLDNQMDFDITLATKKTNENPVYYIQYAHARICSILKQSTKRNEILNYTTIQSKEAYSLLQKISEFEEVVETSAKKQLPHLITNYLYELATNFHTFYTKEKILSEEEKYTSERLDLIEATKITIKNALNLIGVEAPEKM